MLEQNEQMAIEAGEELVPRLANKVFYTRTRIRVDTRDGGFYHIVTTRLCFDENASSELWDSEYLLMRDEDPNGPSIESLKIALMDGLAGYLTVTDEQCELCAQKIAANY